MFDISKKSITDAKLWIRDLLWWEQRTKRLSQKFRKSEFLNYIGISEIVPFFDLFRKNVPPTFPVNLRGVFPL